MMERRCFVSRSKDVQEVCEVDGRRRHLWPWMSVFKGVHCKTGAWRRWTSGIYLHKVFRASPAFWGSFTYFVPCILWPFTGLGNLLLSLSSHLQLVHPAPVRLPSLFWSLSWFPGLICLYRLVLTTYNWPWSNFVLSQCLKLWNMPNIWDAEENSVCICISTSQLKN